MSYNKEDAEEMAKIHKLVEEGKVKFEPSYDADGNMIEVSIVPDLGSNIHPTAAAIEQACKLTNDTLNSIALAANKLQDEMDLKGISKGLSVAAIARAGKVGGLVGHILHAQGIAQDQVDLVEKYRQELKDLAWKMGMPDLAFAELMDICKDKKIDPKWALEQLSQINHSPDLKELPIGITELLRESVKREVAEEYDPEVKGSKIGPGRKKIKSPLADKKLKKKRSAQRKARNKGRR